MADGPGSGPADPPAVPAVPAVPSWLAQLVTAAADVRAEDLSQFLPPEEGGRDSAVLVLFGEAAHGPDVLLIQRSDGTYAHAGQIAFPGGKTEPGDGGPADTALREAKEEVGLDPGGVDLVGILPALHIPVSGYVVTPVLGWWRSPSPVGVAEPAEVARVERVPIAELVEPANRVMVRHPLGYVGPGFQAREMMIWGFTAGLLDRIFDLAGWTRPWNRGNVLDLPHRAAAGHARPRQPGTGTGAGGAG